MARRRYVPIMAGLILLTTGIGGFLLWRPEPAAPLVGVVRATEVRVGTALFGPREAE